MITIIHGPKASGKTHHSIAFRRHYQCHGAMDLHDFRKGIKVQRQGLLILTDEAPEVAEWVVRKVDAMIEIRMIDIRTARMAIGADPEAPPLKRRTKQ